MAKIKVSKKGHIHAAPLAGAPAKPHAEIHVEYHFIETVPPSNSVAGAYVETFNFEDEFQGLARMFRTSAGQKNITWRCHHPFVIIFEDPSWIDCFSHTPDAPFLFRMIGRKPVLVGVKSTHNHKDGVYKNLLTLQINPHRDGSGKKFYYALVPDLVSQRKANGMALIAQAPGRGGITINQ